MIEIDIDNAIASKTRHLNMTNEDYHKRPELSASQIKQILSNPYLYASGFKQPQSDSMALGSAIHSLVLEPQNFDKEFAVMPEINLRTSEGKAQKTAFESLSEGKTILKADQYETATNASLSILKSKISYLMQNGVAEDSFFGEFEGIPVRVRPDYYREDIGVVFDIKTTQDASPDGFTKAVANYCYYVQAAFYLKTLQSLGKKADRFVFIAVETKKPFMVGVYELAPEAIDFGWSEIQRAFEIYQNIDKYKDPIYKDTKDGNIIQTITLPSYVYYKNNASY